MISKSKQLLQKNVRFRCVLQTSIMAEQKLSTEFSFCNKKQIYFEICYLKYLQQAYIFQINGNIYCQMKILSS